MSQDYPLKESDVLLEAKSCIANVEKAGLGKDTIIFADLEYDTFTDAKEKGVTMKKSITTPWTILFCDYVESQGYKAGVYLNQDYYKNYYDMGQILSKGYVIWLADYSGDPNYPCDYQQYSNKGKVSGISGNVDMNYFFGEEKKTEPVTECDASQRQAVGRATQRRTESIRRLSISTTPIWPQRSRSTAQSTTASVTRTHGARQL